MDLFTKENLSTDKHLDWELLSAQMDIDTKDSGNIINLVAKGL
jgi:hypothetical protein